MLLLSFSATLVLLCYSCPSVLLLSFCATLVLLCYSCPSVPLLSFCATLVFLCYSCPSVLSPPPALPHPQRVPNRTSPSEPTNRKKRFRLENRFEVRVRTGTSMRPLCTFACNAGLARLSRRNFAFEGSLTVFWSSY